LCYKMKFLIFPIPLFLIYFGALGFAICELIRLINFERVVDKFGMKLALRQTRTAELTGIILTSDTAK